MTTILTARERFGQGQPAFGNIMATCNSTTATHYDQDAVSRLKMIEGVAQNLARSIFSCLLPHADDELEMPRGCVFDVEQIGQAILAILELARVKAGTSN